MSDEDRELPASEKRRQEFRDRGQVARSRELTMAGVLAVGGATFVATLPHIAATATNFTRVTLAGLQRGHSATSLADIVQTLFAIAGTTGMVCAVTAVAASIAQGGLLPSKAWAKFDLAKLSPLPRLMQLFASKQALVGLVATSLKMTIVIAICYGALSSAAHKLANTAPASLADALAIGADVLRDVMKRAIPAAIVIGIVDYALTKLKLEREMRMSPNEMREENKEENGDPHIKSQRRRRARELLKARSIKAVKNADVVLVNPTHYAVAIAYKQSKMRAPRVVAKGIDESALRIKDVAKEHNVPVVQDIPLARALYARVKVNKEIPPDLYKAVAVTLAFVYRQKKRTA